MKWIVLLPAIFLSACTTVRYKEVKVPVPVPCKVERIAEPTYPKASPDASLFERVKVLLAELELRKGYEAQLVAANAACN